MATSVTQNKPKSPTCKHARYRKLQARLDSFVGWPARFVPKTPEELSSAGFFYIGSADRVTCFQCGITLRDWEEEHDPVREHRRYSEQCQFINQTDLNQLGVNTRIFSESMMKSQESNLDSISNYQATPTSPISASAAKPAQGGDNSRSGSETERSDSTFNYQVTSTYSSPTATQTSSFSTSTSTSVQEKNNSTSLVATLNCPATSTYSSSTSTSTLPSSMSSSTKEGGSEMTTLSSSFVEVENTRLRAQRRCKICKVKDVAILFLPCGHLVTCVDCASHVTDCVLCGKTILGTVKTFFS